MKSMTGFANVSGEYSDVQFSIDIRSVNSRGLDLKIRAPEGIEGLEQDLRTKCSAAIARGSVAVNVRLSNRRDDIGQRFDLNTEIMSQALDALAAIENLAMERMITLAPSKASDLLSLRGIFDAPVAEEIDQTALKTAILAAFDRTLIDFNRSRQAEGKTLHAILSEHVNSIAQYIDLGEKTLPDRQQKINDTWADALARLSGPDLGPDRDRIAQEIALVLIKQDVREELDRLKAHVDAARGLLAQDAPAGRRLDFLTQEFNREANTLCSKAQFAKLGQIGLDLKTVIDQIREQVQNVE